MASKMGAARARRRVVIRGRVQGVFFRASTRERAQELGADGWVRNRSDGSVEAVFEGPPDAVETLVGFCRMGPRVAHVDHLDVFEEAPEGLQGFRLG